MEQLKMPVEDFNLEKFVETTLEFLKGIINPEVDPTCVIDVHDSEKDVPEVDVTERRDVINEMKEFGAILFFPFSEPNVGDPIKCADGNEYILPTDCADDCDNPESECSDEVDDNFCMGDTDNVGYLVGVRGGVLTIDSAMYYSGSCTFPSSSDLKEDCYIFDQPMTEFVNRFIK